MNRWYAGQNPQHMLPGLAACAFRTTSSVREDQISKPRQRRRT